MNIFKSFTVARVYMLCTDSSSSRNCCRVSWPAAKYVGGRWGLLCAVRPFLVQSLARTTYITVGPGGGIRLPPEAGFALKALPWSVGCTQPEGSDEIFTKVLQVIWCS